MSAPHNLPQLLQFRSFHEKTMKLTVQVTTNFHELNLIAQVDTI